MRCSFTSRVNGLDHARPRSHCGALAGGFTGNSRGSALPRVTRLSRGSRPARSVAGRLRIGGEMMQVSWWVELVVRSGCLDEFETLTGEMVASTQAESGVLAYQRFISDDRRTGLCARTLRKFRGGGSASRQIRRYVRRTLRELGPAEALRCVRRAERRFAHPAGQVWSQLSPTIRTIPVLGLICRSGYQRAMVSSCMREGLAMAKHIGIVACSAEGAALCDISAFPPPSDSIWEESMYRWLGLPPHLEHHHQGRPPAT